MNKMSTSSTKSLKKITKKNKRVKKLKETVKYLKLDSYMYSPLLSHGPTHHFSSQKAIVSDTEGMVATKESDKKFGNKVWDYLKTDCYMYAPIVSSTYGQGEEQHHKQAAPPAPAPAPEEIRASKTNEPSEQVEKRQVKKRSSPRTKVVRHTVAYRQTVKQMATLNSTSSPNSGSCESVEKRRNAATNAEEEQLMQIVNTSGGRK